MRYTSLTAKGGSVPLPGDADAPPPRGASGTSESASPTYSTPNSGVLPQFETLADDDELPF